MSRASTSTVPKARPREPRSRPRRRPAAPAAECECGRPAGRAAVRCTDCGRPLCDACAAPASPRPEPLDICYACAVHDLVEHGEPVDLGPILAEIAAAPAGRWVP